MLKELPAHSDPVTAVSLLMMLHTYSVGEQGLKTRGGKTHARAEVGACYLGAVALAATAVQWRLHAGCHLVTAQRVPLWRLTATRRLPRPAAVCSLAKEPLQADVDELEAGDCHGAVRRWTSTATGR